MSNRNNDDLYEAVLNRDLSSIGRLLRSGCIDVNTVSVSGLSPLGAACHLGDYSACQALLNYDSGPANDEINTNPSKKLCLDRKNIGYFIVRKDLDQDDNNFEDFTPEGMENLEWDSEIKDEDQNNPCSYDESYSSLYKYYADILNQTADALSITNNDIYNNQCYQPVCDLNLLDRYGRSALHYACQSGNLKIVQLLIEKVANVNECGKFDGMSATHLAARSNHSEILATLIDSGARIDCQDVNGRTPLHYASYEGNTKCAKLLVWQGANVNCLDNCDQTAIQLACINNQLEIIQLLLSTKKCRINMCDIEGRSALTEAVSNSQTDAVKLLMANGAKVNNSQKLLHMAVTNMNEEMVEILCKNGIQCNSRDDNGNTPLHLAVRGESEQVLPILNILIQHGGNVNALNTITGASILHNLVEFQSDRNYKMFEKILEKMLLKNVKIDKCLNDESALRMAICQNKCQIAICLIRFGANLTEQKKIYNFESILHPDLMSIIISKNFIELAKVCVYSGIYDIRTRKDIVCNVLRNDDYLTVKDFFSLVKYQQPMSLMQICRLVIRKKLSQGRNIHFSLGILGLPKILNDFLDLKIVD